MSADTASAALAAGAATPAAAPRLPPATDPRAQLGEFAHYLRQHGFALGYAEVELMVQAAAALPLAQWPRTQALWRAIASGSQTQWRKYPDLHQAFWFPHQVKGSTRTSGLTQRARTLPELVQQMHQDMAQQSGNTAPGQARLTVGQADDTAAGDLEEAGGQRAQGGASSTAPLDQRDFAEWMPGDMDRFEPMVEALKKRLRAQLLRRFQPTGDRGTVHLRRSLRGALASGGEVVKLARVQRQRRQPRVVVLVDVSRSMEVHAQFYLRLSRAFVEVMDARALVFHTSVADVTPLMKRRSARVQEKVNAVTFGFGGGTRIASCLQEALRLHLDRRSLQRGDLFMVFSDGYDTDPPEDLGAVLAQVRARGARVCWLHPTVQAPQSEALLRAAAQVNRFMPAHNLASLARLPDVLRSA
jgi:uncharacterized protein with von Willebrand factor type A (vWA) domain